MLLRLTVLSGDAEPSGTEVLVEADPAATVASVAAGLADAAGTAHTALFVGDLPALPDVPWSEAGLRDGMRVGLGSPVRPEPRRPGTVELAVTCGPGAGLAHRLRPGEYRAGDAPGVHIPLPVPEFRLRIDRAGECAVRVTASASLDERPLRTDEWTRWPYATPLNLGGDHRLEVAPLPAPDAAVRPSEDGFGVDFNRPPRLHPPDRTTRFRLPSPPTAPEGRGALPMLPMLLVPLVGAVAMVGVTKNYQFLFLALLGPVAMLGNMLLANRQGWKRFKQQQRKYEETKRRIEDDATLALRAERAARRAAHPDPAAVLRTATGPYGRLWERRRRDPDFLSLRVGLAELPSEVVLEDPTRDEHRRKVTWRIPDVPVALPVREHGVVGLAGEYVDEVAGWLVAQAAAWHSPTDLQIHLLAGQTGEHRWSWASHLPHVRHDRPGLGLTRIGSDAESLGRRVAELGAIVQQRGQRGAPPGEPEILVVLDGARKLRTLPGVIDLLRSGPAVGVHFLCVDTAVRELPEEATAVVIAGRDGLEVRRMKVDTVTGVLADEPAPDWFDRFARALAPVRDTGGDEEDVLPGSVRLLDLLSLEPPTAEAVTARWALSSGGTTRAVIGATMDGEFAVDLDRDGPHGLIAGTTGSGKSELLQTIVASLAVANRPDELNFVLVDYKGGSAFAEAAALPHTVGMVTDLHQFEATRALSSLGAELTRREHVLATVQAKDLPDYRRKRGPADPPLPRLLLVIDEFGTLARQLPDFVSGLVNLAQRGRSLGIHLLLATQRPAGVVTGDIRANTNLRIALRVTDPADSRDVIDAPDAAAIGPSQAGRGYARLDSSSLLPFQTARVGGRRLAATAAAPVGAPVVRALGWRDLGASVRVAFDERELMADTDLKALVGAITTAASAYPAPFRPWLPPLPQAFTLADLPAPEGNRVAYGLIDLPAEQEQRPLWFDLDRDGHLHLVGSPGSGRTQALRTLAGALSALPPSVVQFHGIDCGNGGLLELTALPHTGAIAQRTETDRVVRLLERLTAEVGERQKLMAHAGAAGLSELPAPPPHLVVFIDRWEMFLQTFAGFNHGEPVETVLDLLREGASVGVHIVVSGDRSLSAARFSATTPDRLVLHQYDRGDYVTAGLQGKRVPLEMPPGRAIRVADHAEIQLALLADDPSGPAQAAALRELASRHAASDARPWAVDALPDVLSFEAAWDYVPGGARNGLYALAGIGGDSLAAVGADLSVTPTFMVAGPPRAGRSSALLVAARSLLAQGAQVLLLTPRPSPLRALSHEGVVGVLDGPNPSVEEFRALLGRMTAPTGVVIVDDADLLLHADVGADLQRIAKGGAGEGWALIAGGTTEALLGSFHGWQVDIRRNRQGLVLSPQAQSDGEVVGIRIPHGVVGPRVVPGKGHVHLGDGRLVTVRIPVS